jgi:hypothetical protein
VSRRDLRLRSRSHEGLRETRRGREHEAALLLRQRNAKSLSRTVGHRLHVLPLAVEQTATFLPNQGLTVRLRPLPLMLLQVAADKRRWRFRASLPLRRDERQLAEQWAQLERAAIDGR